MWVFNLSKDGISVISHHNSSCGVKKHLNKEKNCFIASKSLVYATNSKWVCVLRILNESDLHHGPWAKTGSDYICNGLGKKKK